VIRFHSTLSVFFGGSRSSPRNHASAPDNDETTQRRDDEIIFATSGSVRVSGAHPKHATKLPTLLNW
jgi:hypothetical protein